MLGEEERGQSQYQVMCFATKFNKGDFISSDAMAKLRQKNPHTIRTPEEDKGRETYTMSSWVQLNRSLSITRHLQSLCAEATDATYVRDVDLKAWAELPGELTQTPILPYFPCQQVLCVILIDFDWLITRGAKAAKALRRQWVIGSWLIRDLSLSFLCYQSGG